MLNSWLQASKSYYGIYKNIANHVINGTENSKEYKMLLDLLKNASELEKKKMADVDFSYDNIVDLLNQIVEKLKEKDEDAPQDLITDNDYVALNRIYTILDEAADNCEHPTEDEILDEMLDEIPDEIVDFIETLTGMPLDKESITYIDLDKESTDGQLEVFYNQHLPFNIVYVFSLAKDYVDNKEVRDFIIRSIYYNIFISSLCEEEFRTTKKIHPVISIASHAYKLDFIDDIRIIDEMSKEMFILCANDVLEFNDDDLLCDKYYTYIIIMVELMANIISLDEISDLDDIISEYRNNLSKDNMNLENKTRILADFERIFEASRKIITDKNKKFNKRVLKENGKTSKKTD